MKKLTTSIGLLLLLGLAACNKSGGDSGPVVAPVTTWQGCGTCGNMGSPYPGLVGVRSQSSSGNVYFALDIVIDQSRYSADWSNPKAFLMYAGPASLVGYMRVMNQDYTLCNLPQGDYEVHALDGGTGANYGVVSGGTYEAVSGNGSRMVFGVRNSAVYNSSDSNGVANGSSGNRIGLNLSPIAVNNYQCGSLSTY